MMNRKVPSFGALLRITWQHVRNEMHEAIHAAGFTDFQDAHFTVFSYLFRLA